MDSLGQRCRHLFTAKIDLVGDLYTRAGAGGDLGEDRRRGKHRRRAGTVPAVENLG